MSYLRSSHNYIWNTNSVLGKGATGAVYAGMHKLTGEAVAVKSFNHLSHMRPYEVQKREFEVLKKVNHENIVKLLAIEEETGTLHKVLIMELCTGGSLFNILDDPINCYGLEEREFLFVLKHLAAGMKHLRDMKIIHRDLKPGNIMKFVSEDATSIYKLTDFGAARELEEDQQFMSLYGTEEYLHPDLYERAVLRKPAGKSFKANVDLWSIGVTLYHIATGSLPFRPYGGRKNKETMFKITTEKASGIISGIQHSENGEIEWSRTLPKTCLLSSAVQPLVTQLLAGLLECDEAKMWSFEKFFKSVTNILQHKIIHVFYVNNLMEYVFYCHPTENSSDLKKRIESSIKISIKSQLILWNKQQLNETTLVAELNTTQEIPLLLLNSESTKIKNLFPASNVKFPEIANTPTNCDQDAQMAKVCASMAYSIQRSIEKCVLHYCLAMNAPSYVILLIDGNVKLLSEKQQACLHLVNSLQHQLDYLNEMNSYLERLTAALALDTDFKSDEEPQQLFDKLMQNWNGLSTGMNEKVKNLNETWFKESSNTNLVLSAQAKAKYYCGRIRESWQLLHKNKQARALSYNEEQLHQLEKIKLDSNCKRLSDLLFKNCYPGINDIAEKLEDWYSGAQVAIVQSECLFGELSRFTLDHCETLQSCMRRVKEDQRKVWQSILTQATQNIPEHDSPSSTSYQFRSPQSHMNSEVMGKLPPILVQEIESIKESTKSVWQALQERDQIMAEFESLLSGNAP